MKRIVLKSSWKMFIALVVAVGLLSVAEQALATSWAGPGGSTIDNDYAGANISLVSVNGSTVYLKAEMRDNSPSWFYWNFRVKNAAGKTITFSFEKDSVGRTAQYIGHSGPCISVDDGMSWGYSLPSIPVSAKKFTYTFPSGVGAVRFCQQIPLTKVDWDSFISLFNGNANVAGPFTLSQTFKNGLTNQYWRIGKVSGEPLFRVLLTSRHHACESTGTYGIEGIVQGVLAATAEGQWLRDNVEFLVVPFVDLAGTEAGDQGKYRTPHDHNADYSASPIYPEVAAIQALTSAWGQGKMWLYLDMHSPGNIDWPGYHAQKIYAYHSGPEPTERNRFLDILKNSISGPLVYDRTADIDSGTGVTPPGESRWTDSDSWMAVKVSGIKASIVIETPYGKVSGVMVSASNLRAFGQDVAKAVKIWGSEGETQVPPIP